MTIIYKVTSQHTYMFVILIRLADIDFIGKFLFIFFLKYHLFLSLCKIHSKNSAEVQIVVSLYYLRNCSGKRGLGGKY